jgi:hypothetical protein
MRNIAIVLAALCAAGCATTHCNTLVLQYRDFGPQAMSYNTIGMEWWQWDNHGDSNPYYQYDIKVVVYRDIPLHQAEKAYPVVKEKEQDYRYLSYDKAMAYLDSQIQEDVIQELTAQLRETKSQIEKKLGKPNNGFHGTR